MCNCDTKRTENQVLDAAITAIRQDGRDSFRDALTLAVYEAAVKFGTHKEDMNNV